MLGEVCFDPPHGRRAGEEPMASDAPERTTLERLVALGKDLVALLRDGALLVLAFLLIVLPVQFNTLLVKAGFKEGSVAGFKWEAIIDTNDALLEAQATIASLQEQLEKTTQALAAAKTGDEDEALKASLAKLEEENRRLKTASAEVAANVRTTLASNVGIVEQAQSAVGTGDGMAVIFGSDVSLDAARDEIARASRKGIPGASVYLRNGYYASIAVAPDRSTAQEYLAIAKTFRPDAYVASMSSWCRNPKPGDGFVECESRR